MSNGIRLMCPNLRCRAILSVPPETRGRIVRCKNCGSNIRVPDKPAKPAAPEEQSASESKEAA